MCGVTPSGWTPTKLGKCVWLTDVIKRAIFHRYNLRGFGAVRCWSFHVAMGNQGRPKHSAKRYRAAGDYNHDKLLRNPQCNISLVAQNPAYHRYPRKSSYLYKTKLFRRHTQQISTTFAAFFIIIVSASIFQLIKTINSKFFKTFSQNSTFITYEVLHRRMCPYKTSYLDTCLWHL